MSVRGKSFVLDPSRRVAILLIRGTLMIRFGATTYKESRCAALCFTALLSCGLLFSTSAHAHQGHHEGQNLGAAAAPTKTQPGNPRVARSSTSGGSRPGEVEASERISGQGAWRFRVNKKLSELPARVLPHLRGAHGGFAVNWRGQRETYFALKGCGIIRISPDLASKEIIDVDPFVKEGNFHNTTLVYDSHGTGHLALPDNERQRVYITNSSGELLKVLSQPRVNTYYEAGGGFVPTDVEQVPGGDIFVVTGYSKGDYVVSADPFKGTWKSIVFGGRGREHGKFGTGHGITWNRRQETLDIADRPHSRVESFDTAGRYQKTVSLPSGSWPCDVDFLGEYAVIGCLKGPGGKTPAPVYIVDKEGEVVSTVKPKEDLGLRLFTHIHNVVWHVVGDGDARKVYLLCQAWNPGAFAVLEQVK